MAARRCSVDGISYPDEYRFSKCFVCGESTFLISNTEPDEDWDQRVKHLKERLELAERDVELIPTVETRVRLRDGQLWVSSWDIINSGIRHRLNETDLIQVGQQTFEILHYNDDQREYLVRTFSLTLSDDDLANLAEP